MNAFKVGRRYLFTGRITLATALHIGGGQGSLSTSDSPISRTRDNTPFIPGSSFKGAFRSAVEKLVGSIAASAPHGKRSVRTCALTSDPTCLTGASVEQRQRFEQQRRTLTDQDLLTALDGQLCDTCKLFGSPYAASHLLCSDLYPRSATAATQVQVRDGVGIDRDSECAAPLHKYDFEVLERAVDFDMSLTLENPSARDLQLTCVGLTEFMHGFVPLGGMRSRGLGRCVLTDLAIYTLDLTDPRTATATLRAYLLAGLAAATQPTAGLAREAEANRFLARQIDAIFSVKGSTHA